MWTHRKVTPFTRFLPVLGLSGPRNSTSYCHQHSERPWVSCTLPLAVARHIFYPWEIVHITPFGTTTLLPVSPERLLPMTVRFWRISMETPSQDFFLSNCPYPVFAMNPQVREYLWQHSLSGMRTLTLDCWMIFRGTTLFNSSPPLVGRHAVRTAPSQARFSLSVAFASVQ